MTEQTVDLASSYPRNVEVEVRSLFQAVSSPGLHRGILRWWPGSIEVMGRPGLHLKNLEETRFTCGIKGLALGVKYCICSQTFPRSKVLLHVVFFSFLSRHKTKAEIYYSWISLIDGWNWDFTVIPWLTQLVSLQKTLTVLYMHSLNTRKRWKTDQYKIVLSLKILLFLHPHCDFSNLLRTKKKKLESIFQNAFHVSFNTLHITKLSWSIPGLLLWDLGLATCLGNVSVIQQNVINVTWTCCSLP